MSKSYKLCNSPLYRMRNRRKLALLLELPANYFTKDHVYKYYQYYIPKSNGDGERQITIPLGELKKIQKRIFRLLERIETPYWVMAGKKKTSYINNACFHEQNQFVQTMDISRFYDSVTRSRVFKMFLNIFKMSTDISWIMTDLVIHDNALPTGSSSSQLVAFWAYSEMFTEIHNVAEEKQCLFTLYVDDMTFSSSRPISKDLCTKVAVILKKNGLRLKLEKRHYYQSNKLKIVTGVGIKNGEKVLLNRSRERILTLYGECKCTQDIKEIERLKGMMYAARQVEADIFPEVWNFVKHYDKDLKAIRKVRDIQSKV